MPDEVAERAAGPGLERGRGDRLARCEVDARGSEGGQVPVERGQLVAGPGFHQRQAPDGGPGRRGTVGATSSACPLERVRCRSVRPASCSLAGGRPSREAVVERRVADGAGRGRPLQPAQPARARSGCSRCAGRRAARLATTVPLGGAGDGQELVVEALAALGRGGERAVERAAGAVGEQRVVAQPAGQAALDQAEDDDQVGVDPHRERDRADEDPLAEASDGGRAVGQLGVERGPEHGPIDTVALDVVGHTVEAGQAVEHPLDPLDGALAPRGSTAPAARARR